MALVVLYLLLHVFLYPLSLMANQTAKSSVPKTLNITAISATNGASTIECWQLAAPFVTSSTAGVSGAAFAQLGKAGNTLLFRQNFEGACITPRLSSKFSRASIGVLFFEHFRAPVRRRRRRDDWRKER